MEAESPGLWVKGFRGESIKMKVCSKCKKGLPLTTEYFSPCKANQDGFRGRCRDCINRENRKYRSKNKEQINQYGREHYNKDEERIKWLKKKYNLTPEAFDILLHNQGGVCAICKTKDWGKQGPIVDHNHITGQIRGILCSICNKGIGCLQDSPTILRLATDYLEKAN